MAIEPDFLSILVCPASRKPLREATVEELDALNERIRGGRVRNRGGADVTAPLEAGLVPEDEDVIYPVQEGIPVLLVSEAIGRSAAPDKSDADDGADPTSPGRDAADGSPPD